MKNKMNVLLIMSDEHDKSVLSCYGDPIVQTPQLQKLSDEGVTFDSFYTTSPLCVPARLSFTAGKYPSRIKAWTNHCELADPDVVSLPRIVNRVGYESFLCGKMHYSANRNYGFTSMNDNDIDNNCKGGPIEKRTNPNDKQIKSEGWLQRTSEFFVGNEQDSYVIREDLTRTKKVCDFLKNRKKDDKPFFLTLGYIAPHFPLIVPEEYYLRYKDRVDLPDLPENYLEKLPVNYREVIRNFGIDASDKSIQKKGRELYWALVNWLDDQIGIVLQALQESSCAENTIVIYTSDHGENKGDHGMWWKNNMYEHAVNIPLIIKFPDKKFAGERRGKAASMVDLTKTIADITGASIPLDWDGDSLLPYIENQDYPWKDIAISEYYGHNIASGFCMIRKGRWKYVYHNKISNEYPAERELFDLNADSNEWNNLAFNNKYQDLINDLHLALRREIGRDPEDCEEEYRRDYEKRLTMPVNR